MKKRKLHTKLWIGIGVFVLVVIALLYIFFVRGILTAVGPANPPENITQPGALNSVIKLPPGFTIEYYAENVTNARSMVLADQNTVFVGSLNAGNIYALRDFDSDHYAEKVFTIASGLDKPNGVAFANGTLYVTTTNNVFAYNNIVSHTGLPPLPKTVYTGMPNEEGEHDWRYTAVGPDNKLYIAIGAPCNVCEIKQPFASIARMNLDGKNFELYAEGIRNSVGFDWDTNGKLWFTDNGRDWLGDDAPGDELNSAPQEGMHFGFPFCQQGNITDPDEADGRQCSEFTAPELVLGPHVAALGMRFYDGDMFPDHYKDGVFIAEHGSWNRKDPLGYRVMFIPFEDGKPADYEIFAEGWLQGTNAWGRPVDVEVMPDGSLLVSDDKANAIYRISYSR